MFSTNIIPSVPWTTAARGAMYAKNTKCEKKGQDRK